MKVAYLINSSDFFVSHFLVLAKEVLSSGARVYVICGDDNSKAEIERCGLKFIQINLTRSGINPLQEIKFIRDLYKVMRKNKFDLVHSLTIKPVIYLGALARLFPALRPSSVVASITGLGSASLAKSVKGKLVWFILKAGYRFALSLKSTKVVFENEDDRRLFCLQNIVPLTRSFIVNGAGVDTLSFSPSNKLSFSSINAGPLIVVLVARLLKDKGVVEYIAAGKKLKEAGVNVTLKLVGNVDPSNISSMKQCEIDSAHKAGYIDYLGFRQDIASIYRDAHVACLPSYREGLPKSLIEAASCGLAIITTDVPGCRQMVIDGKKNGLLFPAKNSEAITNAVLYLESNRHLLVEMGKNSREFALSRFDHKAITSSFFELYGINKRV